MTAADSGNVPGTSKTDFLRSVREALGRSPANSGRALPPARQYHRLEEMLPQLEERAAEMEARLRENRPQLLDRFTDMAGRGGWNVHRVSGVEAAVGCVDGLIGDIGPPRLFAPASPYSTRCRWIPGWNGGASKSPP